MKNFPAGKIVFLLMSMLMFGCVSIGIFNQNQAQDSAEFLAAEDADATRKPFSREDLSGIFAYINYRCQGGTSCQSIGISSPDWSTGGVLTTHTVGMAMFPIWSPDGRYIAYPFFEMEKGFYNEIRLFDFRNNSETTITSEPIYGTIDSLTWAPDNRSLVFGLSDDTDDSELFSINIKKQEVFKLSNSPEFLDKNPAWSPTGDVIAFDSDRDGSSDIWTISPAGKDLHNLTAGDGDTYDEIKPSWSPDGSQIAFYRFETTEGSLWLMEADGSGQRKLFEFGKSKYEEIPKWSHDGEWIGSIAGSNPVDKVWLVNSFTGENIQVSAEPGHYGFLSWVPDSSAVAYIEDVRTTGIPLVHIHAVDGSDHYSWEAHVYFILMWSPVGMLP